MTADAPVKVLLLSGGMDSAALAALTRPDHTLFINYGQRPAITESKAAAAIAEGLGLPHSQISAGLSDLGRGLLASDDIPDGWPSPEWWPFRNQLLVTVGAAWAITHIALSRPVAVQTGTMKGDRERHKDGDPGFYQRLNELFAFQEGEVLVETPGIESTTEELLELSKLPDDLLAWTHSCHKADLPCLDCPGCYKREGVLANLGRLS